MHGSTLLGKRFASEMTLQLESSLTEYYRQECLRSLYKTQDCRRMASATITKRKRVSIAPKPEIIGSADPLVDRRPIDVSPFSKLEMFLLLSQRTFPLQG